MSFLLLISITNSIPFKKRMVQCILQLNPLLRILYQHLHDQVLCLGRVLSELIVLEVGLGLPDETEGLLAKLALERHLSCDHVVEYATDGPDVDLAVVAIFLKHFWGNVGGRATRFKH